MRKITSRKKAVKQLAGEDVTPYDILACKDGSVFGNEYTEDTYWTGSACADAGRPDLGMEFYQHFDDCFYKFNEVRFLGFFNYFDDVTFNWNYCSERGGMNDDSEMTKPVTFTIGVYEEGEDGLPGRCILQKDMDILGERTDVYMSALGDGPGTYIYEFAAPLGEMINLEHGFIQINAKDMGDSPSCWFALMTVGGNTYAYQKDIANEEYSGQSACAFCLYGDGSLNANKALQLERFLTPSSSANGKYEKVQVEIINIGADAISDATLELYVDGNLVATEKVDATLAFGETHKHTFTTRVDCTEEHEITVKNITPNDEAKAYASISRTVVPSVAGTYPECYASIPNTINITNFKLGNIDNTTEGSTYSDFTDKKVTIRRGETLDMSVTIESTQSYYTPVVGVFIDWDGDYAFSSSEAVTFGETPSEANGWTGLATVSMPEGATIGEHCVRVVAVPYYYDPDPASTYYYADVEDYTIVVEPSPTDPVGSVGSSIIEQTVSNETRTQSLVINNSGSSVLTADIDMKYVLPGAPTSKYSSKVAPKGNFVGKFSTAGRKMTKHLAPASDTETQYVLKYDSDIYDCIGLGNSSTATFANMYPGEMLSNIAGMKVSSVDVYIGDVPASASIVVYGENSQTKCGDIVAEKSFIPTKDSWNHVVLDQPVDIDGTDLWIGVKMNQLSATGYYIGVDEGPAIVGFSDIVNIGGDIWWSMSDLGLDYSYCIRANVTGTRTPAINWLSVDKESVNVSAGLTSDVNISFAPQGLGDGLYEAYLEVSTNDPLNKFTRIPVYMIKENGSSIQIVKDAISDITLNGNVLNINGDKGISRVRMSDVAGRSVLNMAVESNEASLNLATLGRGVYIVTVAYSDGTSSSVKVPVFGE